MKHIQQNNQIDEVNEASRLAMANRDLLDALDYLLVLERAGEIIKSFSGADADVLRKALLCSAIVAYCRPFGRNAGAGIATDRIDISAYFNVDLILHQKLFELRDKAIAHADADMVPVQFMDHNLDGMMVVSEPMLDLLAAIKPKALSEQIGTLLGQIQAEMHSCSDRLRRIPGALGPQIDLTMRDATDAELKADEQGGEPATGSPQVTATVRAKRGEANGTQISERSDLD